MRSVKRLFLLVVSVTALLITGLVQAQTVVRVGWVPGWSPEANIALSLKNTNLLSMNHVKAKFVPFVAGGPATEAMLAGHVDVIMVGDTPAISLASRGAGLWVAKLQEARGALVVRKDSGIKSLKDLQGKKVAAYISSGVYGLLYRWLSAAHVLHKVQVINMDPSNWMEALQRKDIAAFQGWDPIVAAAAAKPAFRILKESISLGPGVTIMRKGFVNNHPREAVRFLAAYKEAMLYMATHHHITNKWVAKAAGLPEPVIAAANKWDPTYAHARTLGEVEARLTNKDLSRLHNEAKLLVKLQQMPSVPDVKKVTDRSLLVKADAEIKKSGFTLGSVTVDSSK